MTSTSSSHSEAATLSGGSAAPPDLLQVRNLTVRFGSVSAVDDVSLRVQRGEVLALLGPSGSGKSTLLGAVAGFWPPEAGEVLLHEVVVAGAGWGLPPERRDVAVVFQNYALWPHLTALDTVAYPIRRTGRRRQAARTEAASILELLRIAHLADRRPAEMSGGEQQRVGLARALARRASLYLFDEPTAHLDAHVRGLFLAELVARRQATGAAAVYTTHDAEEALGLADRVALLDNGRLVQCGTPEQVYSEPVHAWAAHITGAASIIQPAGLLPPSHPPVSGLGGTDLSGPVLVRPGWARFGGTLPGRIRGVRFRGPDSDFLVETPAGEVLIREPGPPTRPVGAAVEWTLTRAWPLPLTQR
jgi:ABC-type Fe3+/spermidine/putrescine transport system ATPase subunit